MKDTIRKTIVACIAASVAVLAAERAERSVVAQATPSQSSAGANSDSSALNLQRSVAIYNYKTTAESGWGRGEEIYYIKCWMCHNEYTIKAGTGAVHLKDLYKRPRLTSGQPVNDQTVAEKIRNGGPAMPAYRHVLSDADMADLLSYLREGHCCFEGSEPPRNPAYRPGSVEAQSGHRLLGGTWGLVRSDKGYMLEGIGIQLIDPQTNIRTTVYTNEEGRYEFPKIEAGTYTLRVTRPLEFKPYRKDSVRINGATRFEDITLARVSETEFIPPTTDILAQLSGLEWMMNLPGTGKEKRVFTLSCGFGCHSYQQIFRNRYDERSWRLIVRRMLRGAGSPLINMAEMTPDRRGRASIPSLEEEETVIQWLARVRGPESADPPIHVLPRARGAATRVILTEYELPRTLLAPHDVHGDSQGRIWYSPHRSPYLGALDPRTGKVQEFRPPDIPGVLPGTHRIWVDERDRVWASENWAHNLMRLDPRTGEFKRFFFPEAGTLNSPGFSNFAMDPKGFVYETLEIQGQPSLVRIDRETGKIVKHWPFKRIGSTYDNIVSMDGRYWAGGITGGNLIGLVDTQTDQLWELETPTLVSSPSRGGFDREGNAWFGGRGGMLIKLNPKTRQITEYYPPFPYEAFYEVLPDKSGTIWAWALHGGRLLRFNPKTERWIDYMLAEPYSHNRRTWIDNSTDPVTVWYVDHNGYMVRIQPLE